MHNHIVIVCPSLAGSGAVANVAIHHARELAARHYAVTLVSESFSAANLDGVEKVTIKVPRFGLLRRLAHVPREVAFALKVRAIIAHLHAQRPVGLVMCHGHVVAALAARSLQRTYGIPYSIVTHGDIFDRPKGTYDWRLTWLYKRTTPLAYQCADLVIAISPYMADLAIRGGAQSERVILIPNGVDLFEIGLQGGVLPVPRKKIARLEIVYVGRLSVEKGVDVLICAASHLSKLGTPFRLRIAGSGVMAHILKEQVNALSINNVVEFLGTIQKSELAELFQSADVLCVPSRSEPFSIATIEAMACGLAVVGSNTGGLSFLIDHEVNGLLFPPENPEDLAMALNRLAKNVEFVEAMGKAGKEKVAKQFTWNVVGNSLAETIEKRFW